MSQLDTFFSLFVSRRDDFALQRDNGLYTRARRALLPVEVSKHLAGTHTLGSYVIDERGYCRFGVLDADSEDGLLILRGVQSRLALDGVVSYLEQSRRGGHLWTFFAEPVKTSLVRAWLLPYRPAGMELYPKQNEGNGYGSLIRLPLGLHKRSGKRYPFVTWTGSSFLPVATSVQATLEWLATVQRVPISRLATVATMPQPTSTPHKKTSFSIPRLSLPNGARLTIREWCAQQDHVSVISQYVSLTAQGVGQCPFAWHHANGCDRHASFKVYTPGVPGGYCWYCHVWQQGGSVFDFLRYYRNVDARTLWQALQQEGTPLVRVEQHTTVQVTRGVQNTLGDCLLDLQSGGALC